MNKNAPLFCQIFVTIVFSFSSLTLQASDSLGFSVTLTSPANTPEARLGFLLNTLCDEPNNDKPNLLAVCRFIDMDSSPATVKEIARVMGELSPKPNTSTTSLASPRASLGETNRIGSRLSVLRNSTRQPRTTGFRSASKANLSQIGVFNVQGENDSGGLFSQRLSGFFNVAGVSSEQLESQTEIGYESTTRSMVLGIDYRVKPMMFIGIASQYTKTSANLTDEGSDLKASQLGFVLYGTYFLSDNWYLDMTLSRSRQALELNRKINLSLPQLTLDSMARSETSSQQYGGYFGSGYHLPLKNGFVGLVSMGVTYTLTDIDAYDEANTDDLGLQIDAQSLTSLTYSTNVAFSKAISTSRGVLIPQLSATWIHEVSTEEQNVSARFSDDVSNTQFSFTMAKPDPNYFIIGADLQMILPRGHMAYLKYANVRRLRDKIEYVLSLGYRLEF